MKTLKTLAIVGTSAVILSLVSMYSNTQGTSDRGGNNTIRVSGGAAEDLLVCNGGQVQWMLVGREA